jgi:cytochrome P450
MTTRTRTDGAPDLFKVVGTAAWLNFEGAARTVIRGRRGWVGAVNTAYDPLDPRTAAQPHAAYRRLHETGRVHYNPRRAMWVLSRLDDVRATLRATDKVTSSQGVTRLRIQAPLVVLTDGEEHARLRKQIQPMFTTGAMASWRAMAEKLASEMVDELVRAPGSDVMTTLATPLPMSLIAHIMGVSDGDFDDFRRWSETTVRIMDANATPLGIRHARDAATGLASLRRYFTEQFDAGRIRESDSALGRLMNHSENGALTGNDLFMIAMLLLVAGNETTTNLLGGMFETFARNPEEYDRVRQDPGLVPMAIEEHLRFSSPIQNLYRYTRADYDIAGVTIPRGSRVLLSFGAANRDPEAFEEPDTYRADRNPRMHVGFGHGAHLCVGAPLARMEAHVVLTELLGRVSRIELSGDPTWSTNSSLRGPTRLPVRLVTT